MKQIVEKLTNYLQKYCANITLAGEASTIQEGLTQIENHQPDVIFLDVEMLW